MFYRLPPAGDRIILERARQKGFDVSQVFKPFSARFYGSGKAALAAVLKTSVLALKTKSPEVVLPAYGCPDLISAVLCAGARPRLVDFVPDRPWMDLEQIRSALGPDTAAVIAVDLFGIPERHDDIKALLQSRGIPLIQDSAQALPDPESGQWRGDYIVLSFGRGKPVCLLGGGVALFRDADCGPSPPKSAADIRAGSTVLGFRIKALLYNTLISPHVYWLPALLPFLGLGRTVYRLLDAINPAAPVLEEFLVANVREYWKKANPTQDRLSLLIADVGKGCLIDLGHECSASNSSPRLLRFPLLVATATLRDRLFRVLDQKGLGASKMYPGILPMICGLANQSGTVGAAYPNAKSFSRRILTLPVHLRVGERDLQRIHDCIRTVIGD